MKRGLLILLLMCLILSGKAQDFEGVVRWSMAMNITDPKLKAQMEEAKKKASDPANQAKMKELRAKMDDPQMKAMFEQNPQMKMQMEAALKMMEGGDMDSMLPKEMAIKIKGGNTSTKMVGGMMDGMEVLYLKEKNTAYQIDRKAKTYKALPKNEPEKHKEPKVTKTSETRKILGHLCTKYIIEFEPSTGAGKATSNYWATTEIKGLDMKAFDHSNKEVGGASLFFNQADGMPLLIETVVPQGTITVEAKEVTKGTQLSGEFVIPSGFTQN